MKKNWISINIGGVPVINGSPAIITSYQAKDSRALLRLIMKIHPGKRDLVEIRYDLLSRRSENDLQNLLSQLSSMQLPYIFTYRTEDEEEARIFYSIAVENDAPAIDVDMRISGIVAGSGCMIRSYHGTHPDLSEDLLKNLLKMRSDVVKVAVAYESRTDFLTDVFLMQKVFSGIDRPLCFSPMGKDGFIRAVAAYFISDFVYASGGRSTAPGQLDPDQYRSIFKLFRTVNTGQRSR